MDQEEFVLGLRPVNSGGQSGMVRPRLVSILVRISSEASSLVSNCMFALAVSYLSNQLSDCHTLYIC